MHRESRAWQAMAFVLLVACTSTETKSTIQLGLVVDKSGLDSTSGVSFERIAQLAVEQINSLGGVNGHPLALIVKDDVSDAELSAARLQEIIDEGAVGSVGPANSDGVLLSYPIGRDQKFPFMSPSSTAPSLSTVDDGGYMFRDLPNDSVQGLAMAYYMTAVAKPAITHATLVYEDTTYGNGLADAFQQAFAKVGGSVEGRVTFEQGGPSESPAAATKVMDDLAALPQKPSLIVLVGLDLDGAAIVNVWDGRPAWRDVRWFFTDSIRSAGFLAHMPASCAGMFGTAPTFPTLGDAYGVLQEAYTAKYPMDQLDQESYAPNVWDAVYLFASALVAQDAAGEAFGGEGLRDRLTQISKGPGLILHSGQWRDIIGTLRRGNDIDYDGTSGPVDLDPAGEAIGPYEVWKIVPKAPGYLFEQALFIDAKQIAHLRGF